MSINATFRCPLCVSDDIYVYRIRSGVTYYKCNACGSIFSNPIVIPDKIVEAEKE